MSHLPRHRKAFFVSLVFHATLLTFLLISFEVTQFRAPPSSAQLVTVQATAVTQAQLNTEIQVAKKNAASKPPEKAVHEQAVKADKPPAESVLKAQQLVLEKKAEAEKKEALAKANALKLKELQEKKKKTEIAKEKEKQEKLAKEKKMKEARALEKSKQQAKNKALLAKQQALQQKLLQQQIASEQKNISQVLSTAQEGVLDQYKAQILSIIQSNWRIDKVDSTLKCIYSVRLAPDGTVISEDLIKSSGDENLDQSAKQAILLSSPLPVPTDPVLFDHFRQLSLTLSPQGYLSPLPS